MNLLCLMSILLSAQNHAIADADMRSKSERYRKYKLFRRCTDRYLTKGQGKRRPALICTPNGIWHSAFVLEGFMLGQRRRASTQR